MGTLNIGKDLEDKIKRIILDTAYPIGNYIITVNNKNPKTYLGGEWQKVSAGRTIFTASSDNQLGYTVDSGLPNITGHVDPRWSDSSGGGIMMCSQNVGSLYTNRPGDHGYWWATIDGGTGNPGENLQYHTRINFDASKSNSIYGRSSIVQPPAVYVYLWRRIA